MSLPFLKQHKALSFLSCIWLAGGCHSEQLARQDFADSNRPAPRIIRIAADPNNLPFTNDRGEGFENKIAKLLGQSLGVEIQYEWRAQRRGFFRETLKNGDVNVVLAAPAGFDRALTTQPYYRSTYVFVTRADRNLTLTSLDDPALRTLKVGVQLVGADGADTPPAHALARRGIIDNVVGFTLYGDYRQNNPPARIVDAVASGEIDTAIVWGPLAAFAAAQQPIALILTPISSQGVASDQPLAFSICMAVRKSDALLCDELNRFIEKHQADIDSILDQFQVPHLKNKSATERVMAKAGGDDH